MQAYDIIVVGAGHAGIEASLAASRLGCKTLLVTLSFSSIAAMSCNPAIGGVGKAQLVREIDALGGAMAKAADNCAIQFRMLNASKGLAAQSLRCQIDRYRYGRYMQKILKKQKNLYLKEAETEKILVKDGVCIGITANKQDIYSKAVIVTPGTFLNGVIHVGLKHYSAGRIGEKSAVLLSQNLKNIGFDILRFKTGTCARLDTHSIDYRRLLIQPPDKNPEMFSYLSRRPRLKQLNCYITYTNPKTHEIILKNLDRSPLYTGLIKAVGVRYCPSIEDKVVKFPERIRHQIFLEPEGLDTNEVYPNGLSTSLPTDVQEKMLHSIEGLERARILRFGYGIEHDVVEPRQLYPTLETKRIENLYFAGQINGTTGYEEAAAQGLVAGINASLKVKKKSPFILDRASSYIGVLIDDLVTKGTNEPYRMFTSRVEYRLLLRQDNADLRLGRLGFEIGLVDKERYAQLLKKENQIRQGKEILKQRIKPGILVNDLLYKKTGAPLNRSVTLEELLKRPQIDKEDICGLSRDFRKLSLAAQRQIEIEVKYAGFMERQIQEVKRFKHLEKIRIPQNFDFNLVPGLSREIKEKLSFFRPLSLGQASRISGVTPASISILMVYFKKIKLL